MAYDEGLAERIRAATAAVDGMAERKMFGGIAFLHQGNMAFGIIGDELMVRVGRDGWADALTRPHVREMDFTGRPSKGMVYVGVDGIAEDDDLRVWLDGGLSVAAALPLKLAAAALRPAWRSRCGAGRRAAARRPRSTSRARG